MTERRMPRMPSAPVSHDKNSPPRLTLIATTRGALAKISLRRAAQPASRRPELMEDARTIPDRFRVVALSPDDFARLTQGDFDPEDRVNRQWMNGLGIFLERGDVAVRVGREIYVMDTSMNDFGTLKVP